MTRLQDFGGQSLSKYIVVRSDRSLVIHSPKTANFLVVVTVLGTKVPADSITSNSFHWPNFDVIVKKCLLVILNFENFLALSICPR